MNIAVKEVAEREMVWEGGVVSTKVPAGAKFLEPEIDGNKLQFLQWPATVIGGMVNHFVHTAEPETIRGTRIRAKVTVWKKIISVDRSFFYVDLLPVDISTPITHRMVVTSHLIMASKPGWVALECPRPLAGTIAFLPPGDKLM